MKIFPGLSHENGSSMSFHKSYVAAALLVAALDAPPHTDASPRFTIENKTDAKINVYIYKGDDALCSFEEKLKSVSSFETDEYGCTGGGKGQCKVSFYASGTEICKNSRNTCTKNAIKPLAERRSKLPGMMTYISAYSSNRACLKAPICWVAALFADRVEPRYSLSGKACRLRHC